MSAVSPERVRELSLGNSASTCLGEILAVDFSILMRQLIPVISLSAEEDIAANSQGILHKLRHYGQRLWECGGEDVLHALSTHPSDSARGLAVFGLARAYAAAPLTATLDMVRPFACDVHFGVREWAWLAVRPHLVKTLFPSIHALAQWTGESDVNLRRFAVEALRPRGVWCLHISELRANPEGGLALLEPMRQEPEKYAQDSVANWLNDASKDHPDWVMAVCQSWEDQAGDNPHTRRIIRRALRSIRKQSGSIQS